VSALIKFLKANPYIYKIRLHKNKLTYKMLKKVEESLESNLNFNVSIHSAEIVTEY